MYNHCLKRSTLSWINLFVIAAGIFLSGCRTAKRTNSLNGEKNLLLPPPATMPDIPATLPVASVNLGDTTGEQEVKTNFPMYAGPFEPTWQSIQEHYSDSAANWLREAKFGIWVHFGPQASGASGDWYARKMYIEGSLAYENHLKQYGHPTDSGYKELLRDWNPRQLDPKAYVKLYHSIGARFLLIQAVHHDNYDLWDSRYQPWNSINMGPRKDLLGAWAKAVKEAGMHYGIAFHHEYTWWWWQTAFRSDSTGPYAGKMYDGRLTLKDGVGKWWEGYDPRLLYGINLREYKGMDDFRFTIPQGIFTRHLDYARWYADRWALRILDAVNKYDPDFIYTDGNTKQPFFGAKSGAGYRCDAHQRVVASYFNQALARHGKPDVFSITKFFPAGQKGIVTTLEGRFPGQIKTDQPWLGENAVGDWYYSPGYVYDAASVIRFLVEYISRDGAYAVSIPIMPDGSLHPDCLKMLHEIGDWMKINGNAVYGSKAWITAGEGKDGKLRVMPGGNLGEKQAGFKYEQEDLRFTVGKDGRLNIFTMMIPQAGSQITVRSLGKKAGTLAIKSVELLGYSGKVMWSQQEDGLYITVPDTTRFIASLCFSVR
ncbi:alpha-L-fucosidase [Filimonas effusa]|nr:alpha-L-fucosidase [Filimonas effusa]